MPRYKLTPGGKFPAVTPTFHDVLGAIQWVLEKAESKQLGPDLSRNPNSKLGVIKRCQEEIIRLRRQIAHDVAVIGYLEKKLDDKEVTCSSQKSTTPTPAPDVKPTSPVPPSPAPTAASTVD